MRNIFLRELRTEIEIAASPDEVWNVFADFESYPDWTGIFSFPGVIWRRVISSR